MQLPRNEGLLARLMRASFSSAQAPQTTPIASTTAWEGDPRWGREHWQIRRDPVDWPKKERVAVVLAIPFGFPDFNFKVPEGGGTTGQVARIHVQVYGPKFGIWRLFEVLDRQNVKASFEVSGIMATQFPEIVKEISSRGHEIVGYHWADNIFHDQQSVDQDRELIRRTLSAIEKAAGKRPTGWVAPNLRFGEKTLEILSAEGIQWHACNLSDDRPYAIHIGSKPMIVIPHADKQMDDAGFIIGSRRPPEVFLDFLKRQFRTLHREGDQMGKMFNFSVHPEYGARPFFIDAVEEMIGYLKNYPDVWFTTRQNVADWWTKQKYS